MKDGGYFSPGTREDFSALVAGQTDRLDPFGIQDGCHLTLDANSGGWVDGGHLSNQLHQKKNQYKNNDQIERS